MEISEVFTGAPAEEREPVEQRCYALLDELGIAYRRVDHEPAHHIESCHLVEQQLGAPIAKNLFLCNRQKTQFYLLVMPGDKVFKTKYLSSQLGCARLSFAEPEDLLTHLGVTPGSASLLGLMNDEAGAVHLVLDRQLLAEPLLGLHPCRNTSTLSVDMETVQKVLIPALGHAPAVVELPEDPQ